MASPFSAKNARKAAIATSQLLEEKQRQAFNYLDESQGQATNYLNQNFGVYDDAYRRSTDALTNGYNQAQPYYQQARAQFDPYTNAGAKATTAYEDAAGLNGAEASARASQAFRNAPGYQFAVEQGLDAVNRSAAARGMLGTGNTSVDLMKYATGYADQTYGNYMNRLQSLMQTGQAAAQGTSQVDQMMGQMAMNQGQNLANLESQYGNQIAGVNAGLSSVSQGNGATKANMLMNVAQQEVEALQGAYNAADKAAGNRFNTLMGGIGAAASLFGGGYF